VYWFSETCGTCNFTQASIDATNMRYGQWNGSNFTKALISSTGIWDGGCTGCNFDSVHLIGDTFSAEDVTGATFAGTTWNGTQCPGGADLEPINSDAFTPETCLGAL